MSADTFSARKHRASYGDDAGRDRWAVRVISRWMSATLPAVLEHDVSILPAARTLRSRMKAGMLRAAQAWLVARLDALSLSDRVVINSHYYLSYGIVLKAIAG